jgi:hypothetical protein
MRWWPRQVAFTIASWRMTPPIGAVTAINRLAQREVGAMIDHLVGDKVLPDGIRQDIIERTDGTPCSSRR